MKLHRLEVTGFGPFLATQIVDFDAFDADGIFLMAGRTGAGKSSILDGVSYALYNAVPRFEGSGRLRSDHCAPDDPTRVRLEFTVGERRWRVTRSPDYERPARRGGGTTIERASAELDELVGGLWVGRAAKQRDVGIALDEVLGLNAQQFQQVILLAQGRFSRFLLAPNKERKALLRTLFGTRHYEGYVAALATRAKDAQRRLDTLGERARTLIDQAERLVAERQLAGEAGGGVDPADFTARRREIERATQRAAYRCEQRAVERAAAEAAHAAAVAAHASDVARVKSLGELDQARERLRSLEAEAPQVAAARDELEAARAGEQLRDVLDGVTRAEQAEATARARTAHAERAWTPGDDAGTDLSAVIDRMTGDLAVWATALEEEERLAVQASDLAAIDARVAALGVDLAALDARRAEIPARLVELDAELADARAAAASLDAARAAHDALADRHAAALEAEALHPAMVAAETAHRGAAAAAADASTRVSTLLQRRLDGYAGELAGTLVDGEPCAVCGSPSHPHPAPAGPQPVTDDALSGAERARETAIARERDAADAARIAREAHATAAARAGGEAAEAIAVGLAAAEAAHRAAEAAIDECARLAGEQAAVRADDIRTAEERATIVDALAAERERGAVLGATMERARASVASARGDHASVAARLRTETSRRDAARALRDARADLSRADEALTQALAECTARIQTSVFTDAEAVRAALCEADHIALLEARILAHTTQTAATRERLLALELELVGVVADDVDPAASLTARESADAVRTAAITTERDALNTAESLRGLGLQIDDASADVAGHAEEAATLTRLAATFAGHAPNTRKMDLETFVLAAELEQIVGAANLRLAEMSSGRYTLHHSDALAAHGAASGLGIDVLDAHTGVRRPPQSLSGGETFLASLALALGLAEVVTARAGGVRLDTLFIDEGFGSLDDETLDLAMRTLDELRQGGRTVGVISHVATMKEQIPAQLVVSQTTQGPSIIVQDHALEPRTPA